MERKPIKFKDKIEYLTLEEVCKRFEGLVYGLCKRWTIRYDIEDLKQIGFIGLVNAYKAYDIEKDVLFTTYASMVVNSTLINNYKSDKSKHIVFASLNTPINKESDNQMELIELISDGVSYEDSVITNIEYDELRLAINKLDSPYREIIDLTIEGKNQTQIGEVFNVGNETICKKYREALEKIKKIMRGDDYMSERKITPEQLKEAVEKHGHSAPALKLIGKKYGLSPVTIKRYLDIFDVRKYSKDYRGSKKGDDIDENATAKSEISSKAETPSFLQEIKTYRGSVCQYQIDGDNVDLQFGNTTVSIQREKIMHLVMELSELNRIIS